jgi:hypothetical protein
MLPTMQNNHSEIAYLLRQNKANFDNIVGIDIDKKYNIKCNGVKKTNSAKKTIAHRLEKQFSDLANVIDKKPNGFIARKKAMKVK